MEKCLKWKVGNGENIAIHLAPWLFDKYSHYLPPSKCRYQNLMLVKQLILDDGKWNEHMIRSRVITGTCNENFKRSTIKEK